MTLLDGDSLEDIYALTKSLCRPRCINEPEPEPLFTRQTGWYAEYEIINTWSLDIS